MGAIYRDKYRQNMELDLTGWGHDWTKLNKVANGLFLGCEDALRPGEKLDESLVEAGVRLPDSRIWAVPSVEEAGDPMTVVAPSGLSADAPGREMNGAFWYEMTTVGRVVGDINLAPVGARGFGYDPVFRADGESRTMAEMPSAAKNAISHRGRAMRRLMAGVEGAY